MRLRPILTPITSSQLHSAFGPTVAPDGAILHWDASQGWQDQTGNQSVQLIGSAYPTVTSSGAVNESGKEWGFDISDGAVRTAFLAGEVTLVFQATMPLMSTLTDATDYSLFGDLLFVRRDGTAGSFKVSDGTNSAVVAYDWDEGEVVRVVVQADGDDMKIGINKPQSLPDSHLPIPTKYKISGDLALDFASLTTSAFVFAGGTRTASKDTTIKRSGQETLRVINTGGSSATVSITRNVDIVAPTPPNIGMFIYVPDYKIMNGLILQISTGDTTYSNMFFQGYSLSATGQTDKQRNGWHYAEFRASDWNVTGSPSWAAGVKSIRIRQTNASGKNNGTIYYDTLYINQVSRPKLMIHCDDVTRTWYTEARPIINSLGIKSCLAAARNWTAHELYMTTAMLLEMQAEGHEVVVHSTKRIGADHQLTTEEEAIADILYNKDFIATVFGEKGARFFVFANGQYWINDRSETGVLELMKTNGIVSARTTDTYINRNTRPQAFGFDNFMLLNEIGPWPGDGATQLNAAVDKLIAGGGVGVEVWHGPGTLAEFTGHMEYIKSKVDAGLLDVVTWSEWYDGLYDTWYAMPPSALTAPIPLSAQQCKDHALPIGTRKITAFPGVASESQINEAAE